MIQTVNRIRNRSDRPGAPISCPETRKHFALAWLKESEE
jgi:hypothetical protein